MKERSNQADVIAKKLEEKLSHLSSGASATTDFTSSMNQLKTDLKELMTKSSGGAGGLSEGDRTFLKELSNETRTAIDEVKQEVLTATEKSKLKDLFYFSLIDDSNHFRRFGKHCNKHQSIS